MLAFGGCGVPPGGPRSSVPTVLHLIESWGPGGAETIFLELCAAMRDRGWESLPAVPREGWLSSALRDRGFEPIFTGGGTRGSFDVRHLRELLNLIRRNDVDVVQTHLFGSALYGGMAARLSRTPAVATLHGDWDLKGTSGVRRVKIGVVGRVCARNVCVSDALRRTCVEEYGMEADGTMVIENGIDTDRFRPRNDDGFREELGVGEDAFLVGAVGNVRPAKNHMMLLRVAAELTGEVHDAHVVLVGDRGGDGFDRLQDERRRLGLEGRVHFAGFREDVARVLNSLDAYVLTSDSEGFSLTTVQAMASGLPVVATKCGGPEVLIDSGRTGFLVERGDSRAMASALAELEADPDRRARVGKRARAQAERRFTLGRMADGYERVYRDVLDADR